MKDQTPRAGDMAVLIRVDNRLPQVRQRYIGKPVDVHSDPFINICDCGCGMTGRVNLCELFDGVKVMIWTADLLRIPPPEEAEKLYGEKSVEVPA